MAGEKRDLLKCMWYGIFFEALTTDIMEDGVRILNHVQGYGDDAEIWRRVKAYMENLEAVIDDVGRCGIETVYPRRAVVALHDAISMENADSVIDIAGALGAEIVRQARNVRFE